MYNSLTQEQDLCVIHGCQEEGVIPYRGINLFRYMPKETMGGEPSKEFDYDKHDRLVEGLYAAARTRLTETPEPLMKLIDGRHLSAIPTGEIARAIIETKKTEGDMTVGLMAELKPEGFHTQDISVDSRDFTAAGHERRNSRRAELMDRLCKHLKIETGYKELKEDEKQVFLEANFVRLLSEMVDSLSDRVGALETELKICKDAK